MGCNAATHCGDRIVAGSRHGRMEGRRKAVSCRTARVDPLLSRHDIWRMIRMVVGILQMELAIDHAKSLKDKRRVVHSLKDRLHREQQVSVAEVDSHDVHRLAMLGVTVASRSVPHCQGVLDRVLDKVRGHRDCVLNDHRVEILTGR